jgi:hypothetical protein
MAGCDGATRGCQVVKLSSKRPGRKVQQIEQPYLGREGGEREEEGGGGRREDEEGRRQADGGWNEEKAGGARKEAREEEGWKVGGTEGRRGKGRGGAREE